MKIKMLLVLVFLVSVCVQAEQIRVPSLKVLKGRFEGVVHYIDIRDSLEKSGFFDEVAGKEVDSVYLVDRLCGIAIALAAAEGIYIDRKEFFIKGGVKNNIDLHYYVKERASAFFVECVKMKITFETEIGKYLMDKHIGYDLIARIKYVKNLEWFYKVFFKDYPEILEELLRKLFHD